MIKEYTHLSRKVQKKYWLLKSEPDTFSIDALASTPQQKTLWEGVRNYQARNYLRDEFQEGDLAFFYHSSCKVPAIVGIVGVTRVTLPDETAWNANSPYFDPKSNRDNPRWYVVEVKLQEHWHTPITLAALKKNPKLADFPLLRKGNRLSVIPVNQHEWQAILTMKESTQ